MVEKAKLMKVYIKIHNKDDLETIACCDEELLNKVIIEENLRIEISGQFFGGRLIKLEDAISILKNASCFNIVGEKIINEAIEWKILPREGVRLINGVPMALKMMF